MRIGALILSVFLLVLQFRMTLVQLDYVIHKDYIIAELCIEKDIVESTCEGKCHLRKELAKVDAEKETDQQRTPVRIQLEELTFIDNGEDKALYKAVFNKSQKTSISESRNTSSGFLTIFIPPPELS